MTSPERDASDKPQPRTVVQIAMAVEVNGLIHMMALDSEGTMWRRIHTEYAPWKRVPGLPTTHIGSGERG